MIEIKVINDNKNSYKRREDLKNTLRAKANKPITNKHDGRVATISNKSASKMGSQKAVQKSINNGFSEEEHFKAAENVGILFENATKHKSHTDTKNQDKNIKMHRYVALFNIGNNPAIALITLKETLQGKYKGNKLYSLELEKTAKL